MIPPFRTLWLSGLHLGASVCRSHALLEFLALNGAERLYLVGDVIDCRELSAVRLRASDGEAWLAVERMARNGTSVCYLPGGSDVDAARPAGEAIGAITYRTQDVHVTARGQRLLVTSGFELDAQGRRDGDVATFDPLRYGWLRRAGAHFDALAAELGQDFAPAVARGVRRRLARAEAYAARFRELVRQRAADARCDGVVCGYLHEPALESRGDFTYAGTGDWVDHLSAIAELHDGRLCLLAHGRAPLNPLESDRAASLAA